MICMELLDDSYLAVDIDDLHMYTLSNEKVDRCSCCIMGSRFIPPCHPTHNRTRTATRSKSMDTLRLTPERAIGGEVFCRNFQGGADSVRVQEYGALEQPGAGACRRLSHTDNMKENTRDLYARRARLVLAGRRRHHACTWSMCAASTSRSCSSRVWAKPA